MPNPTPIKILVIEDDPDGRRSLTDALEEAGYAVSAVATGQEGLQRCTAENYAAILVDVRLPDIDGHEVLQRIRQLDSQAAILLMTAYGTVAQAVAALKAGAYDYILKPLNLTDLQSKVAHAVESNQLRTQITALQAALRAQSSARTIIAHSASMREVLRQVQAVADTRASVLILGESGVGKELVARALHFDSQRGQAPFVALNCGAFSASLLESELFGHEKGAFTGALSRHAGAFERAQGGTLLLDEIGIAPAAVQTRLLRVLETRELLRLGGRTPIAVDARVVSATNRNPEDLVAEKLFRHDLLYRLQVVTIRIPPLRERPEDIRPLAAHFIKQACAEHGRHIANIEPACYDLLERYAWPGNVRELKHALENAVIMAQTSTLRPADLHLGPMERATAAWRIPAAIPLVELEKQAILQALQRHKCSRTLTAEELGISPRTIQRKIKEYKLPF
ncbi:MAG: sigma-54-dependent Fis family transcriptional regulator [Lentisphaerae bacterium]|nr:sigma-54-dependent Fis family transcriptional regulator [Lentisphaerota bacterium]